MPELLTPQQLERVHLLLDQVSEHQRNDFGHIVSDFKPDGSLITACDRWSDAAFVQGLEEIAPGEGVLSEEGSQECPSSRAAPSSRILTACCIACRWAAVRADEQGCFQGCHGE